MAESNITIASRQSVVQSRKPSHLAGSLPFSIWGLSAVVFLSVFPTSGSAQTASLDLTAAAAVEEFVTLCGGAADNPEAAVLAANDNPDVDVSTSEDGKVISAVYDQEVASADDGTLYSSFGVATIQPNLWELGCNVNAYVETEDHDAINAAFLKAIEGMDGISVVGGAMSRFESEAFDQAMGGFSDQPLFIYFVNSWHPDDPLLHMYVEIGAVGFDISTQRLVDHR